MLSKHRFLFEELVKRDFDRKYKGSFLGAAWSVLNPLLSLLIMRDHPKICVNLRCGVE